MRLDRSESEDDDPGLLGKDQEQSLYDKNTDLSIPKVSDPTSRTFRDFLFHIR